MLNNIIHFFLALFVLFFFCVDRCHSETNNESSEESRFLSVPIGVVLDRKSMLGSMADVCMKMGVSDFYSGHPNYTSRLQLHIKNAHSVVQANFAVVELLKNEQVHGIIGPQGSREEMFFAELGREVRIPIISFTATRTDLSYKDNSYFVRTTPDDAVQAKALAAMCQGFRWPQIVVLYEDTDYGSQFMSLLNKAFQEVDIALAYMVAIPNSADDAHILKELNKLETKQTRVFLVHMSPSLGFRLFPLAKKAGVMSAEYAWIITNSLSIFMSSIDSVTRDSMEGVLGIRPYLSSSKELDNLRERWRRYMTLNNSTSPNIELNVYGLWAYDAVTALAMAVEKIVQVNSTLSHTKTTADEIGKKKFRISPFGSQLVNELSNTKFRGLSGDFQLVDGKLKLITFEIFNVIGSGEKTIGFWTLERGIRRELGSVGETTSTKGLKSIMWPGDSLTQPKGWAIPTNGNLRVGIPWKHGFTEFVDVITDPKRRYTNATGFSIDIFLATLEALPFHINYDFYYYNDTKNIDWSYDDMLHKIPKEFDMVVGDTTNWAPRAAYVDFSLPYSESGVILVVKNRKPFDMWIFIRPLRWDLWLTIIVTCILMGVVLCILEHGVTSNGTNPVGEHKEKPDSIRALIPVSILAFPDRNMVSNNWSFFVLISYLFMAFILMQSYTASLSAILTVDQLKFAFSDNYYIGYQEGSFMKQFLTKQLHINILRLRSYSSAEEYHAAISLGSKNGGIDAIFDEIPYMKLFLNKYDSHYKMVGPTYRTGGFGFAFPRGSPLVAHFSKAILEVTQGLFLIIGSITIFSLFCSETSIGQKLTDKIGHFIHVCFHFKTSRLNPIEDAGAGESAEGEDEGIELVQSDVNGHSSGEEGTDASGIEEVPRNVDEGSHVTSLDDETSASQDSGTRINSSGGRNS
ncbi:hypothetical protein ACS0TY_024912 [Phlomoides rotata]